LKGSHTFLLKLIFIRRAASLLGVGIQECLHILSFILINFIGFDGSQELLFLLRQSKVFLIFLQAVDCKPSKLVYVFVCVYELLLEQGNGLSERRYFCGNLVLNAIDEDLGTQLVLLPALAVLLLAHHNMALA
jgi:hypothetical protein